MRTRQKITLFVIVFSVGFYFLRTGGPTVYYNVEVLIANLGGLTYLYSTVGIIFAIFAAFVILSEVERWNNLVSAVKEEVGELHELWLWSRYLPTHLKEEFEQEITEYLKLTIASEWGSSKEKQEAEALKVEQALISLHDNFFRILREVPDLMSPIFSTFGEIVKHREQRVHHASFRVPQLLKHTLFFSDVLLIVFSLLIGVENAWLDYLFTAGIAVLGFVIYLMVNDLDDPLRPGAWHITSEDYEGLLHTIEKNQRTTN